MVGERVDHGAGTALVVGARGAVSTYWEGFVGFGDRLRVHGMMRCLWDGWMLWLVRSGVVDGEMMPQVEVRLKAQSDCSQVIERRRLLKFK